ncbi:MAG: hypothetical protein KDA52_01410 [Planctomycetaceae bacterium]|nr:hypothetical protein [Planctomycetaceae bacterium]
MGNYRFLGFMAILCSVFGWFSLFIGLVVAAFFIPTLSTAVIGTGFQLVANGVALLVTGELINLMLNGVGLLAQIADSVRPRAKQPPMPKPAVTAPDDNGMRSQRLKHAAKLYSDGASGGRGPSSQTCQDVTQTLMRESGQRRC